MPSNETCAFRLSVSEVRFSPRRRVSHTVLGVLAVEVIFGVSLPPVRHRSPNVVSPYYGPRKGA